MKRSLNLEINEHRIEGVAEKVCSIFGKRGRIIGKAIDDVTNNVTIKIETNGNVKYGGEE